MATWLSVLGMALLGGLHCVSMCSGIVAALSATDANTSSSLKPIQWHPKGAWRVAYGALFYHVGRCFSYVLLGACVASWAPYVSRYSVWISRVALIISSLVLISMGIHLCVKALKKSTPIFVFLEALLWRLFKPFQPYLTRLMASYLPANTWKKKIMIGMLWGFFPCAMIYSTLILAMFSGAWWKGAAFMAALWLGTIPNMVWLQGSLYVFQQSKKADAIKFFLGCLIIFFGILGILRGIRLQSFIVTLGVCLT